MSTHASAAETRLLPPANALFPSDVATRVRLVSDERARLEPSEHALVARAIAKRQHEFSTGRQLARELLALYGVTGFALLADTDRAPLWPAGVIGSISHSHGLCVAAVARRGAHAGIGIDVEEADAVRPDLWRRVLDVDETRWLRAQPEAQQLTLAAIFFSAKESVYKAQFPLTRARLGFHDVALELDATRREFRARTPGFTRPLVGAFAIHEPWVLTGLTLSAGDVPA